MFGTTTENQRVRRTGDCHKVYADTSATFSYPDDVVYPQYRYTKHMLCIRRTSDGMIVPITEYATNAARIAAGPTFGLIDLVSIKKAQRATFLAKVSAVAYELMTPQVLTVGQVYIHPAVDPATNKLHPFKCVVNATVAGAIGKLEQIPQNAADVVWGSFLSEYYRDQFKNS